MRHPLYSLPPQDPVDRQLFWTLATIAVFVIMGGVLLILKGCRP